ARYAVEREAGGGEAAFRLRVDRNTALAARGGGAAARLARDQAFHLPPPVADDGWRAAHGGGDQAEIDHHEAQILALEAGFHQHAVADLPRRGDGAPRVLQRVEADRDAPALLAARGLDHDAAMLF